MRITKRQLSARERIGLPSASWPAPIAGDDPRASEGFHLTPHVCGTIACRDGSGAERSRAMAVPFGSLPVIPPARIALREGSGESSLGKPSGAGWLISEAMPSRLACQGVQFIEAGVTRARCDLLTAEGDGRPGVRRTLMMLGGVLGLIPGREAMIRSSDPVIPCVL